jgi:tRNA nucleotidyltransferase (CCA-adding enzyme)
MVILVDTQTMATVRGMGPQTRVQIIDHHPLARDLPPGWTYHGEPVGATTTLLVEGLAERGIALSWVEATFLLLGIYEDTGSLTYPSTTPRDLRAAAWLMERGADLAVVSEFLHHPLSEAQRRLYDRLLESAQTLELEGHTVIIAAARADGFLEEVSSVAHRLRDLFEPSALFVLVEFDGHVQLVCRTTTDDIDAGGVAAHFGGGGHARAAAAVIRGRSLEEIREELVRILPRHIRPAVTVAEIMSRGVRVFPPDLPIREAAKEMQRTGHEGFPVVREGRVVGLLTRRAVDRAMQHGLGGQPVERVMEKGEVFVLPTDPVEKVQRLMIETGWGQIPVVEDGEVVGIVTRTDLIQLWGERRKVRPRFSVTSAMEAAFPPPWLALVREIGATAQAMGFTAYFVGGLVRDLILNHPIVDVDIVVEGDAIALADAMRARYGGRVVAHRRFGTAKWLLEGTVITTPAGPVEGLKAIDFVTARREFYAHPTALPQVEPSSIKQDLHRRDFTINTLAVCLNPDRFGELLDFYGGLQDLQRGLIRVLHSLSFVEDPTRILRAARLEARLGFRVEPRTEELIQHAVDLLARVSGERIRHEMELILAEPEPERILARLEEWKALTFVMPGLRADDWLRERFRAMRAALEDGEWQAREGTPLDRWRVLAGWGLMAYRLTPAQLEQGIRRLRFPGREAEALRAVLEVRGKLERLAEPLKPSTVAEHLDPYPLIALFVVWVAAPPGRARDNLFRYAHVWRGVRPLLRGDDLRRLGVPEGPAIGEMLRALRAARLDGEVQTREDEIAFVKARMGAASGQGSR